MRHLFVSHEIAVKLKAKGFKEICIKYYHTVEELSKGYAETSPYPHVTDAPLYQQVIDWFETKGITIWVEPFGISSLGGWSYAMHMYENGTLMFDTRQRASSVHLTRLEAYEEAFEVALNILP